MPLSLDDFNVTESLPAIMQIIMHINYNISGSNVTKNASIFSIQALNSDEPE